MVFYEPGKTDHGLPSDPFKACVIPRPIGWISTLSPTGAANLAPYSQFNNLTFDPPYVMFSGNQTTTGERKDSVRNAESTGVFCWSLATWDLRSEVNITSEQVEYGVDEFERAGLEVRDSVLDELAIEVVSKDGKKEKKRVPMVKRSPINFECVYYSTLRLPGNKPMGSVDVVVGRVIGIHIDESVLTDGRIDVAKTVPIARCGYAQYTAVREVFEMLPPGSNPLLLAGLEGSVKKHRILANGATEEDAGKVEPPK
ncbi:FMN-binding flavin reductase family protein [Periconia macrospinosa]|uniref:FMN-binding flavin reductase family protein n=1 Tax=Periconia macrospinosa TaxID=97972 RepID=A0A2V1DCR0_9PLEO|nr:FMN-binding flavin reductase family protein [Periconia macrospinosa]